MTARELRCLAARLTVLGPLCFGCLCVTPGCDGRPVGWGLSVSDGGASDPALDQRTLAPDQAAKQGECVVGINWAACCPTPKPMLESELGGCIQRFPGAGDHSQCRPPTMICPAVACVSNRARSRFAQMGADGHCTWKSECQEVNDCLLALDLRECCSSWDAYPASLLESDPCLYVPGRDVTKCARRCATPSCTTSWPPASMPRDDDYGPHPYCWEDNSDPGLKRCGLGPV